MPQPQMASSAQPPREAQPPAWHMPPNLLASHVLTDKQHPSLPLRWLYLFPGEPPPLPVLPPEAGMPALHPSQLGVMTPPVGQAAYPRPLSWPPAFSWPPGHLDPPIKIWVPQARLPMVLAPVQVSSLQRRGPPPCLPLYLLPLYLPPLAPPRASTPPTSAPHLGLKTVSGSARPPRVHW